MKVLVGGFAQETNSFSAFHSRKEHYTILRGNAILDRYNERQNHQIAGILTALKEVNAEAVPAIVCMARASGGPVEKDFVDEFLKELLDTYDANAPIDGIFLHLHGAMEIVDGIDGCGYILETIRNHVGKGVVITHDSDLHGNITEKMMKHADGIAGFQTYPHKDFFDTGYRGAMHGIMKLQGKPFTQACVRIPMIVPAEGYSSDTGIFADFINSAHELVRSGKIIDFSVYQMQPWLDLPDAGSTVLVTAETKEAAAHYAKELAQHLFDLRDQMQIHLYPIDEVIDAAIANETGMPVILVDSADSPNAGSSADSSFMLSRLLERGETIKTCMAIADPAAVEHAFAIGIGNESDFSLGGAYEPAFQKPIQVHAYVKSLHDGIYHRSPPHYIIQNSGKTAVLQIGNFDIVVFTKMGGSADPQTYRAFGIEPAHYRLVMVKSANQYKIPYSKFSTLFYPTDTPGSSTANLRSLPFKRIPRPFYPLDEIDSFDDTVIYHD